MKRFRFAAVLVALALVAAACGGDDAEPTTTTAAPVAEAGTIVDVATEAGSFGTLLAAADAAGLVETLQGEGPFTVFAPTDDAFAALGEDTIASLLEQPEVLSQILLYHVVPGSVFAADVVNLTSADTVQGDAISIEVVDGGVVLNGSVNVVTTDIEASNGVIHVIDAVIPAMDDMAMSSTIVDVATEAGSFTTLLAAADAAGLVETLQGEGPFTVFAPTDDAFAALGEDTIASLLEQPEVLSQILLYHVVPGSVFAADVVNLTSANTVQGDAITIEIVDGNVVLNGAATVVTTDIEASNGVIHVIDAVIPANS